MGFVITGAQHAREWIATATTLYITHALVTNTSGAFMTNTSNQGHAQSQSPIQNANLHALLDHFDFYIIPAPNPDGYVYTWETDRFWYKNRMKTGRDANCVGVDMNRNWGFKWRPTVSLLPTLNSSSFPSSNNVDTDTSTENVDNAGNNNNKRRRKKKIPPTDPCSHWYPGSRPFQAPEVNHLAVYLETLPRLKAFVDLRSYGQMLSSPFSYSCKRLPKDAENQMEAALGAISALRKPYGTTFVTGSLCSMFYQAHGNIIDWVYKRAGVKYAYAAHLRDTGTYGFALPPHLIKPVGEETVNMIEYLAKFIIVTEK